MLANSFGSVVGERFLKKGKDCRLSNPQTLCIHVSHTCVFRVHALLRVVVLCECNACIMSAHASLSVLRALAHVALRAT